MSDITIPAAAIEAVFKVLYPYMDTGGDEKMGREVCADAIFAMIEAWPDRHTKLFPCGQHHIILPLTEASDEQ